MHTTLWPGGSARLLHSRVGLGRACSSAKRNFMAPMAAISSYAQRCGPAARSSARYSNSSPTTARPPPADGGAGGGQGGVAGGLGLRLLRRRALRPAAGSTARIATCMPAMAQPMLAARLCALVHAGYSACTAPGAMRWASATRPAYLLRSRPQAHTARGRRAAPAQQAGRGSELRSATTRSERACVSGVSSGPSAGARPARRPGPPRSA